MAKEKKYFSNWDDMDSLPYLHYLDLHEYRKEMKRKRKFFLTSVNEEEGDMRKVLVSAFNEHNALIKFNYLASRNPNIFFTEAPIFEKVPSARNIVSTQIWSNFEKTCEWESFDAVILDGEKFLEKNACKKPRTLYGGYLLNYFNRHTGKNDGIIYVEAATDAHALELYKLLGLRHPGISLLDNPRIKFPGGSDDLDCIAYCIYPNKQRAEEFWEFHAAVASYYNANGSKFIREDWWYFV